MNQSLQDNKQSEFMDKTIKNELHKQQPQQELQNLKILPVLNQRHQTINLIKSEKKSTFQNYQFKPIKNQIESDIITKQKLSNNNVQNDQKSLFENYSFKLSQDQKKILPSEINQKNLQKASSFKKDYKFLEQKSSTQFDQESLLQQSQQKGNFTGRSNQQKTLKPILSEQKFDQDQQINYTKKIKPPSVAQGSQKNKKSKKTKDNEHNKQIAGLDLVADHNQMAKTGPIEEQNENGKKLSHVFESTFKNFENITDFDEIATTAKDKVVIPVHQMCQDLKNMKNDMAKQRKFSVFVGLKEQVSIQKALFKDLNQCQQKNLTPEGQLVVPKGTGYADRGSGLKDNMRAQDKFVDQTDLVQEIEDNKQIQTFSLNIAEVSTLRQIYNQIKFILTRFSRLIFYFDKIHAGWKRYQLKVEMQRNMNDLTKKDELIVNQDSQQTLSHLDYESDYQTQLSGGNCMNSRQQINKLPPHIKKIIEQQKKDNHKISLSGFRPRVNSEFSTKKTYDISLQSIVLNEQAPRNIKTTESTRNDSLNQIELKNSFKDFKFDEFMIDSNRQKNDTLQIAINEYQKIDSQIVFSEIPLEEKLRIILNSHLQQAKRWKESYEKEREKTVPVVLCRICDRQFYADQLNDHNQNCKQRNINIKAHRELNIEFMKLSNQATEIMIQVERSCSLQTPKFKAVSNFSNILQTPTLQRRTLFPGAPVPPTPVIKNSSSRILENQEKQPQKFSFYQVKNHGAGFRNIADFKFNKNQEKQPEIKVNPLLAYAGIRKDVQAAQQQTNQEINNQNNQHKIEGNFTLFTNYSNKDEALKSSESQRTQNTNPSKPVIPFLNFQKLAQENQETGRIVSTKQNEKNSLKLEDEYFNQIKLKSPKENSNQNRAKVFKISNQIDEISDSKGELTPNIQSQQIKKIDIRKINLVPNQILQTFHKREKTLSINKTEFLKISPEKYFSEYQNEIKKSNDKIRKISKSIEQKLLDQASCILDIQQIRTSIIKQELGLEIYSVIPQLTQRSYKQNFSILEKRMTNSLQTRTSRKFEKKFVDQKQLDKVGNINFTNKRIQELFEVRDPRFILTKRKLSVQIYDNKEQKINNLVALQNQPSKTSLNQNSTYLNQNENQNNNSGKQLNSIKSQKQSETKVKQSDTDIKKSPMHSQNERNKIQEFKNDINKAKQELQILEMLKTMAQESFSLSQINYMFKQQASIFIRFQANIIMLMQAKNQLNIQESIVSFLTKFQVLLEKKIIACQKMQIIEQDYNKTLPPQEIIQINSSLLQFDSLWEKFKKLAISATIMQLGLNNKQQKKNKDLIGENTSSSKTKKSISKQLSSSPNMTSSIKSSFIKQVNDQDGQNLVDQSQPQDKKKRRESTVSKNSVLSKFDIEGVQLKKKKTEIMTSKFKNFHEQFDDENLPLIDSKFSLQIIDSQATIQTTDDKTTTKGDQQNELLADKQSINNIININEQKDDIQSQKNKQQNKETSQIIEKKQKQFQALFQVKQKSKKSLFSKLANDQPLLEEDNLQFGSGDEDTRFSDEKTFKNISDGNIVDLSLKTDQLNSDNIFIIQQRLGQKNSRINHNLYISSQFRKQSQAVSDRIQDELSDASSSSSNLGKAKSIFVKQDNKSRFQFSSEISAQQTNQTKLNLIHSRSQEEYQRSLDEIEDVVPLSKMLTFDNSNSFHLKKKIAFQSPQSENHSSGENLSIPSDSGSSCNFSDQQKEFTPGFGRRQSKSNLDQSVMSLSKKISLIGARQNLFFNDQTLMATRVKKQQSRYGVNQPLGSILGQGDRNDGGKQMAIGPSVRNSGTISLKDYKIQFKN